MLNGVTPSPSDSRAPRPGRSPLRARPLPAATAHLLGRSPGQEGWGAASADPSGPGSSPGWAGGEGVLFASCQRSTPGIPAGRGLLGSRGDWGAHSGCSGGRSAPGACARPLAGPLRLTRHGLWCWPPELLYKARAAALIRPRQRAETPPGGSGLARGPGAGSPRMLRTRGASGTRGRRTLLSYKEETY